MLMTGCRQLFFKPWRCFLGRRRWSHVLSQWVSCCVYDKPKTIVQHMKGNITYLLGYWAFSIVHLPSPLEHWRLVALSQHLDNNNSSSRKFRSWFCSDGTKFAISFLIILWTLTDFKRQLCSLAIFQELRSFSNALRNLLASDWSRAMTDFCHFWL